MMEDNMLPGARGKVPRTYEVDKERHSESYVAAVRGYNHKDAQAISMDKSKDSFKIRASAPLLQEFAMSIQPGENFKYTIVEMERYRNDPFWKTLSPGCTPRVVPNWWENAIIYQIWTPSFQDSDASGVGDFIGLSNRLENLRRLGVQAVWLNPFLYSDDFNDAVQDHLTVDPKLGINDDAYKLVDAVHDKGLYCS
ncbi:unnamed protein product [Brugia timori]|uniref:Aamy domain-containing protein n=1 Tax=Brugia timori TaxID=42155 RepID=A0A0R3RAP0_9BILA|nr:unnamed protein product [Brugia timori]